MGLREILGILVCPICHGDLQDRMDEGALDCPKCRLRFSIEGEMINMLPEQATELEE